MGSIKDFKEELENFKNDRIWVTKKSRILAEKRTKYMNLISSIILIVYSFITICFSILELTYWEDPKLPVTLFMSIGVFGLSIFIPSMRYGEKEYDFKKSYIELTKLESRLANLILEVSKSQTYDDSHIKEFNKIKKKYSKSLESTLNHEDIDYIIVKKQSDDMELNTIEEHRFLRYILICVVLLLCVVALPLIAIWGI